MVGRGGDESSDIDGDEVPHHLRHWHRDYLGGAWSFTNQVDGRTVEQTYCTPFLGYPFYSHHDTTVHNNYHNDDCPPMRGFYRWHIPDPIHFEGGYPGDPAADRRLPPGLFERQDDVATVAYWYRDKPYTDFPPLPGKEERWPR